MNNLMLDTETMGNGHDGALVAIGAVFFDEVAGLGAEFYRTINLSTAVLRGGSMDPATVMWWLGQDDAARNAIRFNGYHIDEALADFVQFIQTHCAVADIRVWGCSPTFDCEKVSSALKRSGMQTPWRYFNERCYRTIRERNKSVALDERTGLHNALEDAKFQAKHLIKIRSSRAKKSA
jgi:hypothetical protein